MDYTIFASSMGRIKSLENKMLDRAKLESIVEAKDFADAVRMLQDTVYSEYVNNDYEKGLKASLSGLYNEMYKTSPVKEVVDILAVRYDSHNIKSLIKTKLAGVDPTGFLIDAGTIPLKNLDIMIKEENFRDLPKCLRVYVEKAMGDFKDTNDPQMIDITVDKGIYSHMLNIAKATEMDFLSMIVRLMIDIINIKTFIRVKLQERDRDFLLNVLLQGGKLSLDLFSGNINETLEGFPAKIAHTDYYKWVKTGIDEYVKTKDLGAIEKYGDNYIIQYIRGTKLRSFGPEAIVAYIIAAENEIRALRIILTGKKNNVPADTIRERLRDVYV